LAQSTYCVGGTQAANIISTGFDTKRSRRSFGQLRSGDLENAKIGLVHANNVFFPEPERLFSVCPA
jgi:hypothetical protein